MSSSVATHPFEGTTVLGAMTTGVVNCPPDTPLQSVAHLMVEHGVHAVYVFDYGFEDDETVIPWGLVSDLDLVSAARGDLDTATARAAAATPLVTILATDTLDTAARLMGDRRISHLAVLDPASRRPVGVISTT